MTRFNFSTAILGAVVAVLALAPLAAADVPQMINYQGYLTDGSGNPLDTTVSMVFTVYDDPTAGAAKWSEPWPSVTVDSGGFSVILGSTVPIPDTVFNGPERYLGIQVGADPELSPRTRLTSVPYAHRVGTIDSASAGTIIGPLVVVDTTSTKSDESGRHAGLATVNAGTPNTSPGGTIHAYDNAGNVVIDLDGVAGKATIGPGHTNTGTFAFVAGANNTAIENYSTVGGGSYNIASGQHNTISGGNTNTASGDYHATISGGQGHTAGGRGSTIGGGVYSTASGDFSTIAGGYFNLAIENYSTVGGGQQNIASLSYSTVGGGYLNLASGSYSTVGGGVYDTASGYSSTVPGGYRNTASGDFSTIAGGGYNTTRLPYSTIAGGGQNIASEGYSTVGGGILNLASGTYSTVGGGRYDTASGSNSTVPGGSGNRASGSCSFAAGENAKALHDGSFVWSDGTEGRQEDFASTAPNQFLIQATGFVGIATTIPLAPLHVAGTIQGEAAFFFDENADLDDPVAEVLDNAVIGFSYPDEIFDRRLRITAGRDDGVANWQGACIDLHGNDRPQDTDWGGELHLVAGRDDGPILFYTGPPAERMRITGDGNVGIGTSAPDAKLHVATAARTQVVIQDTRENGAIADLSAGANYFSISVHDDYPLTFATNNFIRMQIMGNGNVGIGKVPAEELDVDGTVGMTGFKMATGAGSGYVLTSDASGVGTWQESPTGGIGTSNPQGALDVSSTTGVLIVHRMTTAEREALSAVNGMIIYNTTTNQFNFYENGAWVTK